MGYYWSIPGLTSGHFVNVGATKPPGPVPTASNLWLPGQIRFLAKLFSHYLHSVMFSFFLFVFFSSSNCNILFWYSDGLFYLVAARRKKDEKKKSPIPSAYFARLFISGLARA